MKLIVDALAQAERAAAGVTTGVELEAGSTSAPANSRNAKARPDWLRVAASIAGRLASLSGFSRSGARAVLAGFFILLTGWAGAAAAQAPTVTSVSPTSISTAGGASVTINGTGFTGATTVSFGGTTAPSFTINNSTRITATSPALSSGGLTYVRVTTPGGTSGFTGSSQILVIEPPWNNAYFTPSSTISVGGTTTLGMNIFNSNSSTALTGLSLASAPLPVGLTGSNPTTSCGGTVTYVPATRSLSLSGASIAADSMCNVSLTVTGTTARRK